MLLPTLMLPPALGKRRLASLGEPGHCPEFLGLSDSLWASPSGLCSGEGLEPQPPEAWVGRCPQDSYPDLRPPTHSPAPPASLSPPDALSGPMDAKRKEPTPPKVVFLGTGSSLRPCFSVKNAVKMHLESPRAASLRVKHVNLFQDSVMLYVCCPSLYKSVAKVKLMLQFKSSVPTASQLSGFLVLGP